MEPANNKKGIKKNEPNSQPGFSLVPEYSYIRFRDFPNKQTRRLGNVPVTSAPLLDRSNVAVPDVFVKARSAAAAEKKGSQSPQPGQLRKYTGRFYIYATHQAPTIAEKEEKNNHNTVQRQGGGAEGRLQLKLCTAEKPAGPRRAVWLLFSNIWHHFVFS